GRAAAQPTRRAPVQWHRPYGAASAMWMDAGCSFQSPRLAASSLLAYRQEVVDARHAFDRQRDVLGPLARFGVGRRTAKRDAAARGVDVDACRVELAVARQLGVDGCRDGSVVGAVALPGCRVAGGGRHGLRG